MFLEPPSDSFLLILNNVICNIRLPLTLKIIGNLCQQSIKRIYFRINRLLNMIPLP